MGDALLKYLERGRPKVDDDHVFIRAIAPIGPLGNSNTVSYIVNRAVARAGVKAPRGGAHILRHSAATEMLRQEVSLSGIGAVLRHRDMDSTLLYAKVDVELLRKVAQPWPQQETPC